ncbi:serine hydrolase domain-containing protein [Sphingomonas canadensis]|uniref:Serine hydrolase domain-containing protein n=1 Tax=Sphingomonas canadensis TaxID=1219257 RepID=A0ABW3H9A2_9SPHN|nr:serine hydrolase domain-containing protein [Sphingomonas canadensis]MCW3836958.1 beta-lactamase family protein [Sphingomonas canadensis]
MTSNFPAALDAGLASIFDRFGIPAAVAVAVKGDETFIRTHGPKRIGEPEPVGPDTAFSIASCSKAFCATLAAALVDEGVLAWDDRVADTVPEFVTDDPWITRELRLRDVLGMRTGYKREGAPEFGFNPSRPSQDYFPMMQFIPREAGFREKTTYMNAGYAAASKLITRRTGRAYPDLIAEKLFRPIGMASAVSSEGVLTGHPDHFWPHVRLHDRTLALPDPLCVGWEGSSCVYLSANDVAQWLRFQINEGMAGGRQVISREALGETRKPHSIDVPNPTTGEHFSLYAMGWQQFDYHGRLVYRHTGSELGASTMIMFCPEEQVGVACFVNLYSSAFMPAVYLMLDHMLGTGGKDWETLMHDAFVKRVDEAIADIRKRFPDGDAAPFPADAPGRYSSANFGEATLTETGGALRLEISDRPMLSAMLEPVGPANFEVRHDFVGMEQELYGDLMRLGLRSAEGRVTGFEHSLFGAFEKVAA